jgi:GNAT superfamily N-acetyltransferase
VHFRHASLDDAPLLARLNRQLIEDEGHSNPMSIPELQTRMQGWLAGGYRAVLFSEGGQVLAYALYRPEADGIYLRHLFVVRERRRQGIGRRALQLLLTRIWAPGARITVEALAHNASALAFYRAVGFADYAVTLQRRAGPLAEGALGTAAPEAGA